MLYYTPSSFRLFFYSFVKHYWTFIMKSVNQSHLSILILVLRIHIMSFGNIYEYFTKSFKPLGDTRYKPYFPEAGRNQTSKKKGCRISGPSTDQSQISFHKIWIAWLHGCLSQTQQRWGFNYHWYDLLKVDLLVKNNNHLMLDRLPSSLVSWKKVCRCHSCRPF